MRWRTNIFLLALFALAGMSCAMGPDYSRPDINTADQFRMSDTEGESIANLPYIQVVDVSNTKISRSGYSRLSTITKRASRPRIVIGNLHQLDE